MFNFSPALRLLMALSVLFLIGVAAWHLAGKAPSAQLAPIGAMLAGGEGMALQGARLLEKTGNKTTLRIYAEKAVISEDKKRVKLSDFSLTSYGAEEGPITIIAKEGVMISGVNDVTAGGGVYVMDNQGSALYAEKLQWADSSKTLTSLSPARIFGGNFLIKGNQLVVEMGSGRARLSGGVTAIFQKN
jgi:LPS export ABC transporter protein LptC